MSSGNNNNNTLDSFSDKSTQINTHQQCLCLSSSAAGDGSAGGDLNEVVLVDFPRSDLSIYSGAGFISNYFSGKKIKPVVAKLDTYKENSLFTTLSLTSYPSAIEFFYLEESGASSSKPAIALATSSPTHPLHIYVNHTLKHEIELPPCPDGDDLDMEIWLMAEQDICDPFDGKPLKSILKEAVSGHNQLAAALMEGVAESMYKKLTKMRDGGLVVLSRRSLQFLRLERKESRTDFLRTEHVWSATTMAPQINCMKSLKKSSSHATSPSCLVLGLEEKLVYILAPPFSTSVSPIETFQLSSAPAFISVTGVYEFEYKIAVACRDSSIYVLSANTCRKLAFSSSPCAGLIATPAYVIVASMEREVVAYQWSTDEREGTIRVPAAILAVEDRWEVVAAGGGGGGSPATRFVDGYALALANMEVRVYKKLDLYLIIKTEIMPVAMKFGRYNRHPHSLIYIGSDGSFNVNRISASRLQLTTPIIESVDVETALNESVKRLVGVPPLKIPALDKAFYVSAEVEKMKMKEMYEKYRKLLKPSTTGNGGGTISRMHPHPPPPSITSTDGSMNPTTSTTGNTQLTAVSPITSVSAVSPPQFSFGAALQVTSTVDGSYTTVFRVTVIVENTSNAPMQDVFVTCVPVHKEFVEIVKPVTKIPYLPPRIPITRHFELQLHPKTRKAAMSAISNEAEFICRQIEIIVFEKQKQQRGAVSAMTGGGVDAVLSPSSSPAMIVTSVVELPEIDLN